MLMRSIAFFAVAVCGATLVAAADDSKTWTDPEKAAAEDAAFAVQGEYRSDDWGLQVIALGDDKLEAYLLEGGLPGEGYTKDKARTKLTGSVRERDARLTNEESKLVVEIADGTAIVVKDGEKVAELKRVERKSPTLGAKPPERAIVLFDGSSADKWENGRVEDGLLANNDIRTKDKFVNYKLHLEFRTPYKPFARGQARGNSGVYHQGRFETQVLDSFGLEGRMNELGGIYTIADPLLNMALPPLTWQTYDIDFTAAMFNDSGEMTKAPRITVRLNGEVVQDDVELPHTTPGGPVNKITPEPGPIFIQGHGNPVFYRNIWLVKTH